MIIVSLGLCNEKSNFRYKPFKSKDHLKSQFFFFSIPMKLKKNTYKIINNELMEALRSTRC